MNTRHTMVASALALASTLTAFADVKVNDNFSVGGYIAGSYRFYDPDPGESSDRLDIDAAKTLFTGSFKPVTGVVSLYYVPNAIHEVTVLDAYATLDVGGGSTITAGKFLSYLGYEAFDIANMNQITYANGDFLAPIPGYHTGVKYDYSDKDVGFGFAVIDSVYSGPHYLKGDGELKHNAGFEGYFVYKAIPDMTAWFGFAYDTKGNVIRRNEEILTLNGWLSYNLSKESTLALEYVHKDGGIGDKGYNWLVYFSQQFTPQVSSVFRISGEEVKDGPEFLKYTVSPAYKVNDNFLVRAEVSYWDYKDYTVGIPAVKVDSQLFFGLQTVFRF